MINNIGVGPSSGYGFRNLMAVKGPLEFPKFVIELFKRVCRTISGGKKSRLGTPQGGVISPLLANLYLYLLDRIWERREMPRLYGARIVRYADDFVILCKGKTDAPIQMVKMVLERYELQLNEQKIEVVNAYKDSFDFLGFQFQMRQSPRSGKWHPHVLPSKRLIERIKAKVKELTHRRMTPVPLPYLIDDINNLVRGWSACFHYLHSTKVMNRIKWFTEERGGKHLCVRYKVNTRTRGYGRFSADFLYHQLQLYKVPTHAKWKRAQVLQ